jgi:hypothetical protein
VKKKKKKKKKKAQQMLSAQAVLALAAAVALLAQQSRAAECPDLYKRTTQPSVAIDKFPYSFDFEDLQRCVFSLYFLLFIFFSNYFFGFCFNPIIAVVELDFFFFFFFSLAFFFSSSQRSV